jgi:hypothetical protein
MNHRTLTKLHAAALAGLLICQGARAAEPLPEPLRTCMGIRNDTERLACYDAAVAHLESGTDAPSRENIFGASAASRAPAQRPPATEETQAPEEDLRQISGKIVGKRVADGGMPVLTLDNDQVWRQQDADVSLLLEIGDSVTITRASLGTFRLTDKRGRSARFRRVR